MLIDIFGVEIPLSWFLFAIPIFLIFGFYRVARSSDSDNPRRRKEWRPDVDQAKSETMRNHDPGGMNR